MEFILKWGKEMDKNKHITHIHYSEYDLVPKNHMCFPSSATYPFLYIQPCHLHPRGGTYWSHQN